MRYDLINQVSPAAAAAAGGGATRMMMNIYIPAVNVVLLFPGFGVWITSDLSNVVYHYNKYWNNQRNVPANRWDYNSGFSCKCWEN